MKRPLSLIIAGIAGIAAWPSSARAAAPAQDASASGCAQSEAARASAESEPARADAQDEPAPAGPTKEQVRAAITALEKGLASKEPSERIAALEAASAVVHDDVVDAIARAVKDSTTAVRDYAVDLLGKLPSERALDVLHGIAKKDRRTLRDDHDLYVLVLKAIARHGNPKSIRLLASDVFDVENHLVVRARVYGLANIRDRRSVEALFDMLTKSDRRKFTPHMEEVRLAFNILLAVDKGANQDRWQAWWNDHKKTFEIAAEMPKLPEESLKLWQAHWGLERTYERNERRGERGKDPDRAP